MKKLILSAIAVCAFGITSAQEMSFGVKAGANIASVKVDVGGASVSESGTGFFFGGLAEFSIGEKMKLQPELLYQMLSVDFGGGDVDFSFINVPVIFKYYVTEEIAVNAGPSIQYFLDGDDAFEAADESTFKVALDFGGSYDITENFEASLRYSVGLMGDVKVSGLHIGVGYKF